ncbi:MAG TPA: four-helix bundle copper-binding protein [Puia sp.]|nr:four-helix bundle copper-binding protein [Puia sp.]
MPFSVYRDCIDACTHCAEMCHQCADACLEEDDVHSLRTCIRLDLECAAACRTAVEMMQLDGNFTGAYCELCADVCDACAEECTKHAGKGMEHCRICAEACRQCSEECSKMASMA